MTHQVMHVTLSVAPAGGILITDITKSIAEKQVIFHTNGDLEVLGVQYGNGQKHDYKCAPVCRFDIYTAPDAEGPNPLF